MSLKANTNKMSKRGSYIVEACMVLPVFIICVISMALIVRAMSEIETAVFEQTVFLHKADLSAPFFKMAPEGKYYSVKDYDYLIYEDEISDLIRLDSKVDFSITNPLGVNQKINPDIRIMSRAFTGKDNSNDHLELTDFESDDPSTEVVIFPKYGEKYHRKNCRYVKQDYFGDEEKIEIQKYEAEMRGYRPCLICGGTDK